jgi:hypothetical protein
MTKTEISKDQKTALINYLEETPSPELIGAYLCFIENKFDIKPVLFPRDKIIFQSAEEVVKTLEKENKLWHQTEIKIGFGDSGVNEQTQKIYICPFTGKVFGDNTHPNPQDAIYDWVSKCKENTERVGGLRVKRFYVSEDPEVIKNYIAKTKPAKEPVTKVVYSSVLSGKLYNSKETIIEDFKKNYLKPMSLVEVQSQNKFEIEAGFLAFIQKQLAESKIADFVEALSEHPQFHPYIEQWMGG